MSDFCYKLCSLRPEQVTPKSYGISICGGLWGSPRQGHNHPALVRMRDLFWAERWSWDIQRVPFQPQFLWYYKYVWLVLKTLQVLKKTTQNFLKHYNNFHQGILNVFNFSLIYSWAMKCLKTLKINVWLTEDIFYEKLPNLQTFFWN